MRDITAEQIAEIGVMLFGEKWSRPMARAFGVHINTVYKWKVRGAKARHFIPRLAAYVMRLEDDLSKIRPIITAYDQAR